ncbi:unnamed protein product [Didymodactylos carnosus]|uniref:Uncharacterized protein n=1 Tax=Didymodactylos carnosus TaxID=1234261 RepID=A0A813QUG4_9BILA|nr:unnamed protein product [Didymodactylos carnosus]CAF3554167.1 unnamed protein product [Didymodactylos carnosus]
MRNCSRILITITWYKGNIENEQIFNSAMSSSVNNKPIAIRRGLMDSEYSIHLISKRYKFLKREQLLIEQVNKNDYGYYTLTIRIGTNIFERYLYHVIIFDQNIELYIKPEQFIYREEQQINITCQVKFLAASDYVLKSRVEIITNSILTIYDNDPDYKDILKDSFSEWYYYRAILQYTIDVNDHNKNVICLLQQQQQKQQQQQQQTSLLSTENQSLTTLKSISYQLQIQYKAYLKGNYHFIKSFDSNQDILINCKEFDANPKPLYTLTRNLNKEKEIIFKNSQQGIYLITNATWKHRGIYSKH